MAESWGSDDELSYICRQFERVSSLCQRTCAEVEATVQPRTDQFSQKIITRRSNSPGLALDSGKPATYTSRMHGTARQSDAEPAPAYRPQPSVGFVQIPQPVRGRSSSRDGSSTPDSDVPPPPYHYSPSVTAKARAETPDSCDDSSGSPLRVHGPRSVGQPAGLSADDGDWDSHTPRKRHTPIPSRKVRRNTPVKPIRHPVVTSHATGNTTASPRFSPPPPVIEQPQQLQPQLLPPEASTQPVPPPPRREQKPAHLQAAIIQQLRLSHSPVPREQPSQQLLSPQPMCKQTPTAPEQPCSPIPANGDDSPLRPPPPRMQSSAPPGGSQPNLDGEKTPPRPCHDPLEQLIRQHQEERDNLRQQLEVMQQNSLQVRHRLEQQLTAVQNSSRETQRELGQQLAVVQQQLSQEQQQHQETRGQLELELAAARNQLAQELQQHSENSRQLEQELSAARGKLGEERQLRVEAERQLSTAQEDARRQQQLLIECRQQLQQAQSRCHAEAVGAATLRQQFAQASTMAACELDRLQTRLQQREVKLAELNRQPKAATPPSATTPVITQSVSSSRQGTDTSVTSTAQRTPAPDQSDSSQNIVGGIDRIAEPTANKTPLEPLTNSGQTPQTEACKYSAVSKVKSAHQPIDTSTSRPPVTLIKTSQTLQANISLLDVSEQCVTRGIPKEYCTAKWGARSPQGKTPRHSSGSLGLAPLDSTTVHQKSLSNYETTSRTNLLRTRGTGCKQKTSRMRQMISKVFGTTSRSKKATYTLAGAPIQKTRSETRLSGLTHTSDKDVSEWLAQRDMVQNTSSHSLDASRAARSASLQNLISSMSTLSQCTGRPGHGDDAGIYEDVTTDSEWGITDSEQGRATDDEADAAASPYYINVEFNNGCLLQKR